MFSRGRFADACRIFNELRQIGDHDVDLHLQRVLDLLTCERSGSLEPVENQQAAVHLQWSVRQRQQPECITNADQSRLHDQDALVSQHQQITMQFHPSERRVDHDEVVTLTQGFDQSAGGTWFIFHLLEQILLTRQHVQAIGDHLRRALDEQLIDALWRLECGSQSGPGFCVQQQRAAATMEIGIQQDGMSVRPFAQMPGQIGRDGAGADAAAHAGDRYDAPSLRGLRAGANGSG